ncbi:programmed cell death protein 5-like protein [Thamnocephalis sphaerospora]|uniref:Programmed cell death protein 5-like protein n=1 Tax=Thamnocephalis sphaerospora TaxID=78915 RepID=A0A4P9XVY4_9FUNG|nr:programmed cell death protein 5-like protein [Thamnocephalis sphaerospora]|eukprot:RKP10202.1 programmed cell death protein 5-like protein [Thamnocephalis sphaerospora]
MEDAELQAIRARRMAELQARRGGGGAAGGSAGLGMPGGAASTDGQDPEAEARQQQQAEEMRRNMLTQILDNNARERLARISIVKPDKARAVEDLLLRMARGGALRGKVTEQQLIELLENVNQQTQQQTKIVYNRRRAMESDDEDDWDL